MTDVNHDAKPAGRHRAFLSQLVVLFVATAGIAFLIQRFGWHESTRSSFAFAVSIAMVLIAYQVGLHEGRHENDRPTRGSTPARKWRQ